MKGMIIILVVLVGLMNSSAAAELKDYLVSNGKSDYQILLPGKPDSVEEFAGKELQKYLAQISGVNLPLRRGEANGPVISVGKTRIAQKLSVPSRYFDDDGFFMKTEGKDIILLGANSRGTLYAVYAFLERLGCRWTAPNFNYYEGKAEWIPRKATLILPKLDILEQPDWRYRAEDLDAMQSHTLKSVKQIIDWMAKNRLNYLQYPIGHGFKSWKNWRSQLWPEMKKRGIYLELGQHGVFPLALPPKKYFDAHPDWFCLWKGKRIRTPAVFSTANPDAVREFTKNIIKILKEYPEMRVFEFWPPDNIRWSQAPEDVALGPPRERYAKLVRTVAEAIKKEYPKLKVEFLAYSVYTSPPSRMIFPENTLMDFCPIGRSYQYRIYDSASPVNAYYNKKLLSWIEKGYKGDIRIYSYYAKYAWHSLPVIIPRLISDEVKYYASLGIKGMSIYSEPANWFTFEINHLIVARLSWDNDLDVDRFLDDYCSTRFGPAKDPMLKFISLMEEIVPQFGTIPRTRVKSKEEFKVANEKLTQAGQYLKQARQLAAGDDQVLFFLNKMQGMYDYARLDIAFREALQTGKSKVLDELDALFKKYRGQGLILTDSYFNNYFNQARNRYGLDSKSLR